MKNFHNERFCKVLNTNLDNFGFQYKEGLNILKGEFGKEQIDENGNDYISGLYFCRREDVLHYIAFGDSLADVEIPDDAMYSVEEFSVPEYSADKLILSNIRSLWNDIELCELLDLCTLDKWEIEELSNRAKEHILDCPEFYSRLSKMM